MDKNLACILVAEDEDTVRDFVCRALTVHGHTVIAASDGIEAVDRLGDHTIDLVLSDIVMPVMDGITLALKIKSEHPTLPIILMTGFANEQQRAHNLSALIQGLLAKPFTMEQLINIVDQVLERDRSEDKRSANY